MKAYLIQPPSLATLLPGARSHFQLARSRRVLGFFLARLVMLASGTPAPGAGQGVNLSSESVAGEEDPGASLDLPAAPGAVPISEPPPRLNPGDEAPAGTPGTGENICRECGGSGRVNGAACPSCNGSGKVTVGIGGA